MRNKTAKLILVIIASSSALAGCTRPRMDGETKWPKVNRATDSLTRRLDYEIFHRLPEEDARQTLGELALVSENEKQSDGRVDYFRAYLEMRSGNTAGSRRLLEQLLTETDSAESPYLYNRVAHLADDETERSVAAYDRITARLKYFESVGDAFMSAAQLTELGNLLKDVRDGRGAVSAYEKADSLYRLAGYPDNAVWNRMNIASAKVTMLDTAGGVEIYRQLLRDSVVRAQPFMRAKIYHNLAAYTDDSSALDSVIKIEGDDAPAIIRVFESKRELAAGNAASAAAKAEEAGELAMEENDADALAYAIYAAADAYAAMGKKEEAYDYLREAVDLNDAVSLANEPDEIRMLETGRQLSVRRLEGELSRSRRTLVWVCVSSGLLLVLLATLWLVRRRVRRLAEARRAAADERDRVSRELVATRAAMDETSKLITDVGRQIGDMADSGEASYKATRPIVNAIKTHRVTQKDREAFIESYTRTHAGFALRLREINDEITESDIRLAAYIAAGMDNKRIAATIGIRPESVKQGRWRLRTKLRLASGERLEDVLRRLAAG